jgi:hypothetical protein
MERRLVSIATLPLQINWRDSWISAKDSGAFNWVVNIALDVPHATAIEWNDQLAMIYVCNV